MATKGTPKKQHTRHAPETIAPRERVKRTVRRTTNDPLLQRAAADRQETSGQRVQRVASRQFPRATPEAEALIRKSRPSSVKINPATTREEEENTSDRYIWLSLLLLFVAGYLAISTLSYLRYWDVDQNIATWSHLFDNLQQDAQNWGGRIGAILGENIIGRWFGIFGELLPVILFLIALKLLRIHSLRFRRAILSLFVVMILGSITTGHIFGADPRIFGSGWGATHGIFVAQWLAAIIGNTGTTLLLVSSLCGILYYLFSRPIRHAARQLRQRSLRRQEERRLRNELHRLETQQRIATLRDNLDQQHPAATENQPIAAIVPPIPLHLGSEVQSAAPEQPETNAAATLVPEPSQEQPEPTPWQPALAHTPTDLPPIDRTRLIQYDNGILAYHLWDDPQGQPVICAFDAVTYTSWWPTRAAGASTESEEPDFTLETRSTDSSATQRTTARVIDPANANQPEFIVEQPEEEQVDNAIINSENLYDPTLELSAYRKPPVELMDEHTHRVTVTDEELVENKNRILTTLENFGIRIDTIEATIGPTVTLYEIVPAPGVRISKIKNLEDDIALSLSALGIRIIAPIPGKGTVGIEVPNQEKEVVSMFSVIKSPRFHEANYDLPVALGKTISNETFVFDLARMPHLLVAGATGQGKSVGLNAIITSLLYKKHPAELKFVLIDPKKVELTLYSKLEKHFLAKMPASEEAIITDTQKVIYTLNSLCIEMDARYDLLKAAHVRNIKEYNEKFINRRLNPEKGHRYLPYFVVIIDEFADLIMTAGREIETPISRIAQLARAVGIHMVIATQRPTTNIITGVIKANFPARIAFRVTSMIDSRTILDQPGANQLIGRGDMLISTGNEVTRVQCAFIDTPEVDRITEYIGSQRGYPSAYELPDYAPESEDSSSIGGDMLSKRDPLFEDVAHYVVSNQTGSASTVQRKFSIGFNRAGRIVDQLEAAGVLGRNEGGGKPRQVLVSDPLSLEMLINNLP